MISFQKISIAACTGRLLETKPNKEEIKKMRKEHANYTNHHTNPANIRYHWDSLKSQSVQRMFSEEAFKSIDDLPADCCYIKVSILPNSLFNRLLDLRLLNWKEVSCYKDTAVYPCSKEYPYSISNTKTEYFFKQYKDALLFYKANHGGQFYSSYKWSRLP